MKKIHYFIFLLLVLYSQLIYTVAQNSGACELTSLGEDTLSNATGELIYFLSETNLFGYQSTGNNFIPEIDNISEGTISPNGQFYVAVHSLDSESNDGVEVVVFDRNGSLIYSGATAIDRGQLYWLNDDEILKLNFVSVDSDLQAVSRFSYYIIDPFQHTYESFTPLFDSFNSDDLFFYDARGLVSVFDVSYGGRYALLGNAYDFVEEEIIPLENYPYGAIASSTSYNFLYISFSTRSHSGKLAEAESYELEIYNLVDDTLTPISTILLEAPVDISYFDHSWSPDETKWVFVEDFGEEIVERKVKIHNLQENSTVTTCFELPYTTATGAFSGKEGVISVKAPDFFWSRDSRYLALRAALHGQDYEESFGLYLYDTQTEDIYLVHQGDADIIGWMANPEN